MHIELDPPRHMKIDVIHPRFEITFNPGPPEPYAGSSSRSKKIQYC